MQFSIAYNKIYQSEQYIKSTISFAYQTPLVSRKTKTWFSLKLCS